MPKFNPTIIPLTCPHCHYATLSSLRELKKIDEYKCLVCGRVNPMTDEMKMIVKETDKQIQMTKKLAKQREIVKRLIAQDVMSNKKSQLRGL